MFFVLPTVSLIVSPHVHLLAVRRISRLLMGAQDTNEPLPDLADSNGFSLLPSFRGGPWSKP
jgi:hypothetical protein